jgi:hypothetical protein
MSFEGLSAGMNQVTAWADVLQRHHGVPGFPEPVVKNTETTRAGGR